ncbi:MAG: two-component regulator propeller domain-containing protein [Bacteroidota bacterium]
MKINPHLLFALCCTFLFPYSLPAQSLTSTVYNVANSNLPNDNCHGLTVSPTGQLWVGTTNGMATYDGTSWTVFKLPEQGTFPNWIHCLAFDQDSLLWVGSELDGVSVKRDTGWQFIYTGSITDLAVDANNHIWAASNGEVAKYDGQAWSSYVPPTPGIPSTNVRTVIPGNNNLVWIGTHPFANFAGGFASFDGSQWIRTDNSSGLPDNLVNALLEVGSVLWVGMNNGLAKRDNGQWTHYTTANSNLVGNQVNRLKQDASGRIWIATESGLSVWDGFTFTSFKAADGLPDNRIRDIAFTPNGDAWLATGKGVVQVTQLTTNLDGALSGMGLAIYPNPATAGGQLTLEGQLTSSSLHLRILDIYGKKVADLGEKAGAVQTWILPEHLSPGTYILEVQAGEKRGFQRLLVR